MPPETTWKFGGDIYKMDIVGAGGGSQDESGELALGAILAGVPGAVAAGVVAFSGEVDAPFVVLQLTSVLSKGDLITCSVRRTLAHKDLSHGLRAILPPGTTIHLRSYIWNYVP